MSSAALSTVSSAAPSTTSTEAATNNNDNDDNGSLISTGFDSSSFLIFFFSFVVALALTLIVFRKARIYLYRHYGYGTPPRGFGADPLWMIGGWHGLNPSRPAVKRRRPDKFSLKVRSDLGVGKKSPPLMGATGDMEVSKELAASLPMSLELAVPTRPRTVAETELEGALPGESGSQDNLPAFLNVLISLPTDPKLVSMAQPEADAATLMSDARSVRTTRTGRSLGTGIEDMGQALPRFAIGSALVNVFNPESNETKKEQMDGLFPPQTSEVGRARSNRLREQPSVSSLMRTARQAHERRRRAAKAERDGTAARTDPTVTEQAENGADGSPVEPTPPPEDGTEQRFDEDLPERMTSRERESDGDSVVSAQEAGHPSSRWGRIGHALGR